MESVRVVRQEGAIGIHGSICRDAPDKHIGTLMELYPVSLPFGRGQLGRMHAQGGANATREVALRSAIDRAVRQRAIREDACP
jgi:hypothetical protein